MKLPIFSSPETTTAAICQLLAMGVYLYWKISEGTFGDVDIAIIASQVAVAIGLFRARDNNKTSEQVKAK